MKQLNRFLPALLLLTIGVAAASNLPQGSWHLELAGLKMSLTAGETGLVRIFFAEQS